MSRDKKYVSIILSFHVFGYILGINV